MASCSQNVVSGIYTNISNSCRAIQTDWSLGNTYDKLRIIAGLACIALGVVGLVYSLVFGATLGLSERVLFGLTGVAYTLVGHALLQLRGQSADPSQGQVPHPAPNPIGTNPSVTAPRVPVGPAVAQPIQGAARGAIQTILPYGPEGPSLPGIANRFNNCWASTVCQFIYYNPHLRHVIEQSDSVGLIPLKQFLTNYGQAAERRQALVPESIETVLLGFQQLNDSLVADRRCKDAAEALSALLGQVNREQLPETFLTLPGGRQRSIRQVPRVVVRPPPAPSRGGLVIFQPPEPALPFQELMAAQFDLNTTGSMQFNRAPDYFIVDIARFTQVGYGAATKNLARIDIPLRFEMPRTWHKLPEPSQGATRPRLAEYELTSIVIHEGASVGGGHYCCYQKINGRWFLIDDRTVREVNETAIFSPHVQLGAYFVNYSRVAPAAAPLAPSTVTTTPSRVATPPV